MPQKDFRRSRAKCLSLKMMWYAGMGSGKIRQQQQADMLVFKRESENIGEKKKSLNSFWPSPSLSKFPAISPFLLVSPPLSRILQFPLECPTLSHFSPSFYVILSFSFPLNLKCYLPIFYFFDSLASECYFSNVELNSEGPRRTIDVSPAGHFVVMTALSHFRMLSISLQHQCTNADPQKARKMISFRACEIALTSQRMLNAPKFEKQCV